MSITIAGVGFEASPDAQLRAACSFGESIVSAVRVGDLGVLCVSPPHLAGVVPLALAINGHDFRRVPGQFEYQCAGYQDGTMCIADPGCAWCDGGRGCVACDASGGNAHDGGAARGGALPS